MGIVSSNAELYLAARARGVDFAGLIRMMVDADLDRVASPPQLADRLFTL